MRATDKTILIECSECPGHHYEEGIKNMVGHILVAHRDYLPSEAHKYAEKWMDAAYIREEEFLDNYYADRKLEKSIEADREFQTHKI